MNINEPTPFAFSCPITIDGYEQITLAHGGGGSLTHKLINELFIKAFDNPALNAGHDGAVFEVNGVRLAFTTDSYVIDPIFFPGGDIGSLAVYGTVNDLAMCGAQPLYLSVGMIIEEGFAIKDLAAITDSMRRAADIAGAKIVTGDTKVVGRGKGDKIFINTAGIGVVEDGIFLAPKNCRAGDKIILSGRIAEHGIAIMAEREGFGFDAPIVSDCAPLNKLAAAIFNASKNIHVMRDPTRGGVASALNEIAETANLGVIIDERFIPIAEPVKAVCELLGFDALYVANEGKVLVFVSPEDAEKVLNAMRANPLAADAVIIGELTSDHPGSVIMKTVIGTYRIVDMLSGEQLPRIC